MLLSGSKKKTCVQWPQKAFRSVVASSLLLSRNKNWYYWCYSVTGKHLLLSGCKIQPHSGCQNPAALLHGSCRVRCTVAAKNLLLRGSTKLHHSVAAKNLLLCDSTLLHHSAAAKTPAAPWQHIACCVLTAIDGFESKKACCSALGKGPATQLQQKGLHSVVTPTCRSVAAKKACHPVAAKIYVRNSVSPPCSLVSYCLVYLDLGGWVCFPPRRNRRPAGLPLFTSPHPYYYLTHNSLGPRGASELGWGVRSELRGLLLRRFLGAVAHQLLTRGLLLRRFLGAVAHHW